MLTVPRYGMTLEDKFYIGSMESLLRVMAERVCRDLEHKTCCCPHIDFIVEGDGDDSGEDADAIDADKLFEEKDRNKEDQ